MNYNITQLIIKIKIALILNPKKRKELKEKLINNFIKNAKRNARWGVSYSVFDGEELLEKSILSIKDTVDYINVVYSDVSWNGKDKNPHLLPYLKTLKEKGLIDELIEYKINFNKSGGKNELAKRNLGLKYAKKANITYFMTMDVDEFYIKEEIEKTKNFILENGITHCFCNYINYGFLPTKRLCTSTFGHVPFFSKINKNSKLTKNNNIITKIDSTRKLNHFIGAKYFVTNLISMHHMSYIRKDLSKKFLNSNAAEHMKEYADLPKTFLIKINEISVDTKDIFDLTEIVEQINPKLKEYTNYKNEEISKELK
jgi:hypothetical protein